MKNLKEIKISRFWTIHAIAICLFFFGFLIYEMGEDNPKIPLVRGFALPSLRRLSNSMTDLKFRFRGSQISRHPITIIEIDSPALEKLGRWPWKREYIAYLIEKTFEMGAEVVGLDIVFSETEEQKQCIGGREKSISTDAILREVIQKHKERLVLGWETESLCQPGFVKASECPVALSEAIATQPPGFEKFSIKDFIFEKNFKVNDTVIPSAPTLIGNIPRFNEVALHSGFMNSIRDLDGLVRRSPLIILANGKAHPSLSLEMARLALKEDLSLVVGSNQRVDSLRFTHSGKEIPVTSSGLIEMNFRGPSRTFDYVSALELLKEGKPSHTTLNKIRGSAVLIGVSAIGVGDVIATPLDSLTNGVEGHATLLDNLLSMDMLRSFASQKVNSLFLIFLLFSLSVLLTVYAYYLEHLSILYALGFSTGLVGTLFLMDSQILFPLQYNLNTGLLYLEIFVVSGLSFIKRFLLKDQRQKEVENQLLLETIAKERADKNVLVEKMDKTRMEAELRTAQIVQEVLLSPPKIDHPNIELAYYYLPASECGGDLWDAYTENGCLRVFIADATGHGVSAAIVTAVVKSCLETLRYTNLTHKLSPQGALNIFNQIIYGACKGKLLMTMSYLELNLETGELKLGNAGHEGPLCLRVPTGFDPTEKAGVEELFARGECLGFSPNTQYAIETCQLNPGDAVLLYTDGISEATSPDGKEWGQRALKKAFSFCDPQDVEKARHSLVDAFRKYTAGQELKDDSTFVMLTWKSAEVKPLEKAS